ncbi:MAG: 16S rRNA (cytidine(1402)-2'-O)-methyltransferase [Dehalococcoidia bacterium]
MSTLYLVATPIGNLEDITLRALRVLKEVPLIAAEDTRTTRKLLNHFQIRGPRLVSYTEGNRKARTPNLLKALEEGDVALVSEAGMPAISDPGVHLVEAVVELGHQVVPVPGASALTAALAASGLPTRQFHYLGFLPRRGSQRRQLLGSIAYLPETLVAFEAPHRLRASLEDLRGAFGERRVAVCRELTKLHEEVFRGTLSEALSHFSEPRGECTLVIEGADEAQGAPVDVDDIDAQLRDLREQGMRARDAVRAVAQATGQSHREVYQRWLTLSSEKGS